MLKTDEKLIIFFNYWLKLKKLIKIDEIILILMLKNIVEIENFSIILIDVCLYYDPQKYAVKSFKIFLKLLCYKSNSKII